MPSKSNKIIVQNRHKHVRQHTSSTPTPQFYELDEHYNLAIDALNRLTVDSTLLREIATYIVRRSN